jgi:hypothetical protein
MRLDAQIRSSAEAVQKPHQTKSGPEPSHSPEHAYEHLPVNELTHQNLDLQTQSRRPPRNSIRKTNNLIQN